MTQADSGRRVVLLALALFAALFVYAWPDLRAWIATWSLARAAFQTSTPSGCRTPDPGEQLVIIITERHGQLFAQCQYVMSRGAARFRWQGTVL